MKFDYDQNSDEAAQIARTALPMATRHSLPANPIIYTVLYEYVAGLNPKLTSALENALRKSTRLTYENVSELFQLFIGDEHEHAVETMRLALGGIVDSTSSSLQRIDGESKNFHDYLEKTNEQLTETQEIDTRDLIENLMHETEHMQSATKSLQQELAIAREEIAELRDDFKRVHRESLIDPLTGVKNRRAFDVSLEEICSTADQEDWPVCLLLLDIDHFKAINDTHGHTAGDAVLKWVAKVISDTVRGGDIVCRFGGEEFTVILPKTGLQGATSAAENIRTRIADQKLRTASKQIGQITCSIGAAVYDGNEGIDSLISNADVAMYKAKESGRNKVCVSPVNHKT